MITEATANLQSNGLIHLRNEVRESLSTKYLDIEREGEGLVLDFNRAGSRTLSESGNIYIPDRVLNKTQLERGEPVDIIVTETNEVRLKPGTDEEEHSPLDRVDSTPYKAYGKGEEGSIGYRILNKWRLENKDFEE